MSSTADGNQLKPKKSREEVLQRMAELRPDFQSIFLKEHFIHQFLFDHEKFGGRQTK